jgi:hypothetical protein
MTLIYFSFSFSFLFFKLFLNYLTFL